MPTAAGRASLTSPGGADQEPRRLALRRNFWPLAYCVWAGLAIAFSLALAGLKPESVTRLQVLGFLLAQLLFRRPLLRGFSPLPPKARFIALATLLAAVVEAFHMISTPVFLSLRIDRTTPVAQACTRYGLDLLFTLPAYLVIFTVLWSYVRRYQYSFWLYVVLMGLAQALGDGGLFFFAASPALLAFLPYPMSNYHAVNVLPFLAVRDELPAERSASPWRYTALPALIATYLVCGAGIRLVGRLCGLE